MQGPNLCHDNCKNCAKMSQVHHGAVGLCPQIMTPQWNNRASFCVVTTVIQEVGNLTSWTFFVIFSLSYMLFYIHLLPEFDFCIAVVVFCVYCEKNVTIRSCVCYDIILVELWNSSYVVLTVKCVFTPIMVHFQILWGTKNETLCAKFVEKLRDVKYCVCQKHTALVSFCFPNLTFPSTLQFLLFFGIGFEVLTVVKINNVVWVRTLYCLVHDYACFGGAFSVYHHRPSEDGGSRPKPNPLCSPVRLHGPIQFQIFTFCIFLAFNCFIIDNLSTQTVNITYYFTLRFDLSKLCQRKYNDKW